MPTVTVPYPMVSEGGIRGLIAPGNIDLTNRPRVKNPDGTTSTVRTMSFNFDGKEVLLPSVSEDGRMLNPDEMQRLYMENGRHLGIFKDADTATIYAKQLHEDQERMLKESK